MSKPLNSCDQLVQQLIATQLNSENYYENLGVKDTHFLDQALAREWATKLLKVLSEATPGEALEKAQYKVREIWAELVDANSPNDFDKPHSQNLLKGLAPEIEDVVAISLANHIGNVAPYCASSPQEDLRFILKRGQGEYEIYDVWVSESQFDISHYNYAEDLKSWRSTIPMQKAKVIEVIPFLKIAFNRLGWNTADLIIVLFGASIDPIESFDRLDINNVSGLFNKSGL